MREISELSKAMVKVLDNLKETDYAPDEKVAILRGAADFVNQVIITESQVQSLRHIMENVNNS